MVATEERYDVLARPDGPSVWAFGFHVLEHVEGAGGLFSTVAPAIVE